eukprot:bmy_01648T0
MPREGLFVIAIILEIFPSRRKRPPTARIAVRRAGELGPPGQTSGPKKANFSKMEFSQFVFSYISTWVELLDRALALPSGEEDIAEPSTAGTSAARVSETNGEGPGLTQAEQGLPLPTHLMWIVPSKLDSSWIPPWRGRGCCFLGVGKEPCPPSFNEMTKVNQPKKTYQETKVPNDIPRSLHPRLALSPLMPTEIELYPPDALISFREEMTRLPAKEQRLSGKTHGFSKLTLRTTPGEIPSTLPFTTGIFPACVSYIKLISSSE